jgi:hypothetical protein
MAQVDEIKDLESWDSFIAENSVLVQSLTHILQQIKRTKRWKLLKK